MRLLIATQAVDRDDPVLGFFHGWIEEFAKQFEQVTVICLRRGDYDLPANVTVHSLGKEAGRGRLTYLARFFRYIVGFRREYDSVFVHMNIEYVILGGLLWRLMGKRVGLWYLHKAVTLRLRLAERLAHHIFTGSKESFRLPTKKLHVLGQGIDVAAFSRVPRQTPPVFTAAFVGRLSPIKGVETLIEAAALLGAGETLRVDIIGGAERPDQKAYEASLKKLVAKGGLGDTVRFLGPVPNHDLPEHLARASVFVNTSRTGSLDKAGIEPMAVGLPVISCNDSYAPILRPHGLYFKEGDAHSLASLLQGLMNDPKRGERIGQALQEEAREHHNLPTLVGAIKRIFSVPIP